MTTQPTEPPEEQETDPRLARYEEGLAPEEYEALKLWITEAFPYSFQRDWVLDDSPYAIANKSRQIGFSFSTAGLCDLWGVFHGEETTIISVGQKEADKVLEKCRFHARVLQAAGSKMAETVVDNTEEIAFASGGRVIALPSSGGRSFSGNVFLDEFGYQRHADEVWDAAAPVTLLDHKMRVVSTPNGIGNEYHDLWERVTNAEYLDKMRGLREGMAWSPHEVSVERAIADGYSINLARCWNLAKYDERLFAQMFQCSFLDNVLQYIPDAVIKESTTVEPWAAPTGVEYYAGLDIGREVDLSCLIVVRRMPNGYCFIVHVETMKRTDSDGLEAMVDRAFARYKIRRLCIDATGLGTFPAERIKKKHSERVDVKHRRPKVEPIDFTPKSKEALATGLYAALTGKLLWLPASDVHLPPFVMAPGCVANQAGTAAKLRKEIASLRRIVTQSGNVQYSTPRTREGHGDRMWALALALHARQAVNKTTAAILQKIGAVAAANPPPPAPPETFAPRPKTAAAGGGGSPPLPVLRLPSLTVV